MRYEKEDTQIGEYYLAVDIGASSGLTYPEASWKERLIWKRFIGFPTVWRVRTVLCVEIWKYCLKD